MSVSREFLCLYGDLEFVQDGTWHPTLSVVFSPSPLPFIFFHHSTFSSHIHTFRSGSALFRFSPRRASRSLPMHFRKRFLLKTVSLLVLSGKFGFLSSPGTRLLINAHTRQPRPFDCTIVARPNETLRNLVDHALATTNQKLASQE